jgi:hypothetical protein
MPSKLLCLLIFEIVLHVALLKVSTTLRQVSACATQLCDLFIRVKSRHVSAPHGANRGGAERHPRSGSACETHCAGACEQGHFAAGDDQDRASRGADTARPFGIGEGQLKWTRD